MSTLKHQYFLNRFQFWKYLEPKCNGLNLNSTLRLPLGYVELEDGTSFSNSSVRELVECINREFKLCYDPVTSCRVGNGVTLFWEDGKEQKDIQDIIADVIVEEPEQVVEQEEGVFEGDSASDKEEAIVATPETVSEEDTKEVDWGWIETLENTKEDKLALDEYAKDFNIELSRRKTLENMIIDFKEAL